MTDLISACLFGPFQLQRGTKDLRPRGRKACGLLAYLIASDRRSASRARLASLLWSDRGERQARDSLRQTLREIKASEASHALDLAQSDVVLRECVVSDLDRIAVLARRQDCEGVAGLLSGMDGEYLQDLDGLSPAFDDWLRMERVHAREHIFALSLSCLDTDGAVPPAPRQAVLRELQRLDPLNEIVARTLLRLDHANGDIATMHRRYRRLSDDLSRDLNVAPSQETQKLFEALLAQLTTTHPAVLSENPVAPIQADRGEDDLTPPLVAVMTFEADGGPDVSRLGAILTENVCAALSQSREFRIVRSDLVAADRLTGLFNSAVAGFIVRASVRGLDSTATISAELSSAESGVLIWAERFDLPLSDLERAAAVGARIVGAVGPGIERHLFDHGAPGRPIRPVDDAASIYFRGKQIARHARTLDAARQAVAHFERVLTLDPRHVGARLRLAQLHNTDFHYLIAGHDAGALRKRALELALEATDIEPDSVRVRLRLAWCRLRREDWDGASAMFHALEPSLAHDADAANECGFGLTQLGELEAGRELIQRAFRLNPFAPAEYHADFAILQALAGEHRLAESHFELCGEQRLFWRVIRMSNLTRLDASASHLPALQERFVQTFRSIWVGDASPGVDDVLAWSRTIFCFREPDHRKLVEAGLSSACLRFGLEDAGNKPSAAALERDAAASLR